MTHRYSKDPEVDNSLRHSVHDGVAYSVMSGAGETYLSAFAVFLHANTAQIGLLTSLPALIGSIAQLLSAWLGRRVRSRMHVILPCVVVQALVWFPLMWLPVLFPAQAVPLSELEVLAAAQVDAVDKVRNQTAQATSQAGGDYPLGSGFAIWQR